MNHTPSSFLFNVIRPTLHQYQKASPHYIKFPLWSPAAEELLLGTALQESDLTHRHQMNGPAAGLFQMEPRTFESVKSYIGRSHRPLAGLIQAQLASSEFKGIDFSILAEDDNIACIFARMFYYRFLEPIPSCGDLYAQAKYYKKYYNTSLGKATENDYIKKWVVQVLNEK